MTVKTVNQWIALFVSACLFVGTPLVAVAQNTGSKPASKKPASTSGSSTRSRKPAAKTPAPKSDENRKSDEAEDDEKPKAESSRAARGTGAARVITPVTLASLPTSLNGVLARVINSSRWGVEVRGLEDGRTLFAYNSTQVFVPASNRKLFTGALALDQFGPDYQYRTYLYRTGTQSGDVLNGNLVILPQGDPTFSNRLWQNQREDWIFRDWVSKVKAQGVRVVRGELVVDCSDWDLRDLSPRGWPQRVKGDYYAPQTSPLCFNENLITIRVSPGAAGQPAEISFNPHALGYPLRNMTTTGASGRGISVQRDADGRIAVSGTIRPKGATVTQTLPCDNPTLYAAAVFRSLLNEAGITIEGALRIETRKGALPSPTTDNVVAVYISPPMSEMVTLMMKKSNNHFAEQLFVSTAAVKKGRGSYTGALSLEEELLRRAGVNAQDVKFGDGSGLSEMNKVSPRDVVALLTYMAKHPHAKAFFASLPVGGRDGTLASRMRNTTAAQKVFAKTGYINRVSCLSGYVVVNPQHTLSFSFLVNDIRTGVDVIKGTQDKLCEYLASISL